MYDEWKVPGFIDWTVVRSENPYAKGTYLYSLWQWGKRIWTRSLDRYPAWVRCDEDLDCFGPDGEAHKSLLYYEIDYPNLTTRIDARQSVVTSRWKEAIANRTGDEFGPYMESLQWLAKEIFAVCEVIDKRMLIGSDTSQGGKVDMPAGRTFNSESHDDKGASGAATFISAGDLAKKYGVSPGALGMRLQRWRKTHDEGYIETNNPKPRQPKFLYSESAVKEEISALK
jgi:hypothetical protein